VIAYRIVQEAATNARKHSQANRLDVLVESSDGGIHVLVRDDGRGFPEEEPEEEKAEPGHLGIAAMRERAELAGGWLQIHTAADTGTILEAWVPDDEDPSDADAQPSKRGVASARGTLP
jgi:signal transduction histidine kinase